MLLVYHIVKLLSLVILIYLGTCLYNNYSNLLAIKSFLYIINLIISYKILTVLTKMEAVYRHKVMRPLQAIAILLVYIIIMVINVGFFEIIYQWSLHE